MIFSSFLTGDHINTAIYFGRKDKATVLLEQLLNQHDIDDNIDKRSTDDNSYRKNTKHLLFTDVVGLQLFSSASHIKLMFSVE